MNSARKQNYSGLARLEWLQLLAFSFPVIFVTPFIGYFIFGWQGILIFFLEYSKPAIATAILFLLVGLVTSFGVDRWRSWASGVRAENLPPHLERRLENALFEIYGVPARFKTEQFRWYPSDLAMGAHVRGVLRPMVVLSGGLAIGLLRKDPRAIAILSHELAHIEHYDRLLPGLIGIAIFEIAGNPAKLFYANGDDFDGTGSLWVAAGGVFLYKLLVLGGLVWFMSRSREFYADASAAQVTQPTDAYVSLLLQANGTEKERLSLFHPPISKRVEEAKRGFPSLRTRWMWRLYFVAATAMSWFQWRSGALSDSEALYVFCSMWMGLVILATELFRTNLLSSSVRFRVWVPGRRTVRFGFLLLGMLFAAFVGVASESEQAGAIVGGVIFVIFSALKGWSRGQVS